MQSESFDMVIDSRGKCFKAKPGKYGTLYLYRITYCDIWEKWPEFTCTRWAYDKTHAEMKFIESNEDDCWEMVDSPERVEI